MTNKELDHYKETYKKFLEELINLHNLHFWFLKNRSREAKYALHKCQKNIIKLQKELFKSSSRAFHEKIANNYEYFAKKKEEANLKKEQRLRKKQNEQHNSTTPNNV